MQLGALEHDLKHLKKYMKPVHEECELIAAPAKVQSHFEPMGVVGIFSAWNYPIMTALKPVVQAITSGNAVLLKPSEIAANSSKAIKKFVDKHLDNDFIKCVEGGIDVAVAVNNLPLDLICFTGSTFVGKIVAGVAAKNLTRCILELGGKCPCVVHVSCELQHTIEKLCWAKFSNSGQTCIAPDYVFVDERVVKNFTSGMIAKIESWFGKNKDGHDDQGKIINDFHTKRLEKLIQTAGGDILYGGKINHEKRHIQPTLILNPGIDSPIMQEEIFGPVLPIFTYKNMKEVIKFINARPKPLAVYYYGNPGSVDAIDLANLTSSGAFMTNECLFQSLSHY